MFEVTLSFSNNGILVSFAIGSLLGFIAGCVVARFIFAKQLKKLAIELQERDIAMRFNLKEINNIQVELKKLQDLYKNQKETPTKWE